MNGAFVWLGTGLIGLLAGCGTTPVVLAPVGPNPVRGEPADAKGWLKVFSSLAEQSDNQNQASDDPVWYQHTDYNVFNLRGKLVTHVGNAVGHYEQGPRRVALPAGHYLVKAHAKDYLEVEAPVTIEPGRTTRVHLDGDWKPPAGMSSGELVRMPNGNPVGWRAESARG